MAMRRGFDRHHSRTGIEDEPGGAAHGGDFSRGLSAISAPGKGTYSWAILRKRESMGIL